MKMKTRLLIIIGGFIVGFWAFSLVFVQMTHSPIPYLASISTVTTIENGETVKSFHAYPEITMLPVVGFALLILGACYGYWKNRK